jgi:hypothetical protein
MAPVRHGQSPSRQRTVGARSNELQFLRNTVTILPFLRFLFSRWFAGISPPTGPGWLRRSLISRVLPFSRIGGAVALAPAAA